MGGIFSQQLQNPPHPPSGTVSSQNLGPNITTPPRANRSYLSYFLPMSTPELTHTHTHPAGPATINIVARLLTCRGLPFEIAQRIVDDARYWTKCTRTNKKACTVIAGMPPPRQTTGSHLARWTSGQEEEVRADLDVGNSGLRDKKGEVWYLCSSPIGCDPCRQPDDGHTEESESLKRLEDSVDTSWIREIMVETYSRDQGWSDNASHYGKSPHITLLGLQLMSSRYIRAFLVLVRAITSPRWSRSPQIEDEDSVQYAR